MGEAGFMRLVIVLVLVIFFYGTFMTVNAIRRPAEQFTFGKKWVWISVFVLTNPFITRYLGWEIWKIANIVFLAISVFYHIRIFRKKRTKQAS